MTIFFEKRQLVVPGDLLADGNYTARENVYKDNGKVYSYRVGLIDYENNNVSVVALKSFYEGV